MFYLLSFFFLSLHFDSLDLFASSETGDLKKSEEAFAHRASRKGEVVHYEAQFSVPKGFGEIGAVLVENEHHKEMYLNDIVLMTGDKTTALTFDCRSWVHSKYDNPERRIFFSTKVIILFSTASHSRIRCAGSVHCAPALSAVRYTDFVQCTCIDSCIGRLAAGTAGSTVAPLYLIVK